MLLISAKDPLMINQTLFTNIIHALLVQYIEDFELFNGALELLEASLNAFGANMTEFATFLFVQRPGLLTFVEKIGQQIYNKQESSKDVQFVII